MVSVLFLQYLSLVLVSSIKSDFSSVLALPHPCTTNEVSITDPADLKFKVSFLPSFNDRKVIEVTCPILPSPTAAVHLYRLVLDSPTTTPAGMGEFTAEARKKALKMKSCDDEGLKGLVRLVCPVAAVRPRPRTAAVVEYTASDYRCSPESPTGPHTVAVSATKEDLYSEWSPVPDEFVLFSTPYPEYSPKYVTWPSLYMRPWWTKLYKGGYADANFVSKTNDYFSERSGPNNKGFVKTRKLKRFLNSQIGQNDFTADFKPVTLPQQFTEGGYFELQFDQGFPLNPCGRTGVLGRGRLGQWGPQFAADPILTKTVLGVPLVLMIVRTITDADNNKHAFLAIPGGILDRVKSAGIKGDVAETAGAAASRGLFEETGVEIDVFTKDAVEIYAGYSDDLRNTDNAWMETTVIWRHIEPDGFLLAKIMAHLNLVDTLPAVKAARDRLTLGKLLLQSSPPSHATGWECFVKTGSSEARKEAVKTMYAEVFKNLQDTKTCTEAAAQLGVTWNPAGPAPEEKTVIAAIIAKILGTNTVTEHEISRLKDTLVYYSEDKDSETYDEREAIQEGRWLPIEQVKDLPVFALQNYFLNTVWKRLSADKTLAM